MTHPDIMAAERNGGAYYPPAEKIGECLYCEAAIYDDNGEAVESVDGAFCSMECCKEYYEIQSM